MYQSIVSLPDDKQDFDVSSEVAKALRLEFSTKRICSFAHGVVFACKPGRSVPNNRKLLRKRHRVHVASSIKQIKYYIYVYIIYLNHLLLKGKRSMARLTDVGKLKLNWEFIWLFVVNDIKRAVKRSNLNNLSHTKMSPNVLFATTHSLLPCHAHRRTLCT